MGEKLLLELNQTELSQQKSKRNTRSSRVGCICEWCLWGLFSIADSLIHWQYFYIILLDK